MVALDKLEILRLILLVSHFYMPVSKSYNPDIAPSILVSLTSLWHKPTSLLIKIY